MCKTKNVWAHTARTCASMRVNFNEAWNKADLLQREKVNAKCTKHRSKCRCQLLTARRYTHTQWRVMQVYVMAVKMMFTSRNFITAILCAIQKAQIIFGRRQRRSENGEKRKNGANALHTDKTNENSPQIDRYVLCKQCIGIFSFLLMPVGCVACLFIFRKNCCAFVFIVYR